MSTHISVRRIPAQEIPPPPAPVVGKPVTGLKEVRLTHNLIIEKDGKKTEVAVDESGKVVSTEAVGEGKD